VAHI